jgi:hypothetical protein
MGDELSALAKANGYQRGAHRDKDSLRDCKKQIVQPIHKRINEHSDRSGAVNWQRFGDEKIPIGLASQLYPVN